MLLNYLKIRTINFPHSGNKIKRKKPISKWCGLALLLVFNIIGVSAQTFLIDPTDEGGFSGSSFAAGYSMTLPAANSNVIIGQLVTGTDILANTYASNISGTSLATPVQGVVSIVGGLESYNGQALSAIGSNFLQMFYDWNWTEIYSSARLPVVATVNPLPICDITGNNVICAGASASFTATGGTSYSWTGPGGFTANTATISDLTVAGSYDVIVTDDDSFTSSCSRILTVNPLPICDITGNNVICADASASFTATGGADYSWTGPEDFTSNTATISDLTVAGSYNVMVTDSNSCSSFCNRALTVNPIPASFTISLSSEEVCPNGSTITLTARPINTDLFVAPVWSPALGLYIDEAGTIAYSGEETLIVYAKPTIDTDYTATAVIYATGCSTTANTTVKVAAEPVATPVTRNATDPMGDTLENALCVTDTNKVLTLVEGYVGTIQWQTVIQDDTPDSNTVWENIDEANAAQYNITSPEEGLNWFRVQLTTEFCFSVYTDPEFVYYKGCLGIPDVAIDAFAITAYPNPYTDNFSLDLKTQGNENVNVIIFDMIGRLIDRREVGPFELSKQKYGDLYPTGVYNILVTQGTEIKTLRLIKR